MDVLVARLPADQQSFKSARCAVPVGSDLLPAIFEDADKADGFGVSGELVLTAAEQRTLPCFEIAARKVLRETDADFAANDAACKGTRLIDAGAEERIRLVRGFSLTRIALKP